MFYMFLYFIITIAHTPLASSTDITPKEFAQAYVTVESPGATISRANITSEELPKDQRFTPEAKEIALEFARETTKKNHPHINTGSKRTQEQARTNNPDPRFSYTPSTTPTHTLVSDSASSLECQESFSEKPYKNLKIEQDTTEKNPFHIEEGSKKSNLDHRKAKKQARTNNPVPRFSYTPSTVPTLFIPSGTQTPSEDNDIFARLKAVRHSFIRSRPLKNDFEHHISRKL